MSSPKFCIMLFYAFLAFGRYCIVNCRQSGNRSRQRNYRSCLYAIVKDKPSHWLPQVFPVHPIPVLRAAFPSLPTRHTDFYDIVQTITIHHQQALVVINYQRVFTQGCTWRANTGHSTFQELPLNRCARISVCMSNSTRNLQVMELYSCHIITTTLYGDFHFPLRTWHARMPVDAISHYQVFERMEVKERKNSWNQDKAEWLNSRHGVGENRTSKLTHSKKQR